MATSPTSGRLRRRAMVKRRRRVAVGMVALLLLAVLASVLDRSAPPVSAIRIAPNPVPAGAVEVIQTSPTDRVRPVAELKLSSGVGPWPAPQSGQVIDINDQRRYEPIWGVGASLTNSSAFLLTHELSPSDRARVLNDLFSPLGAHFSWIRIPIGGSDFNASQARFSEDDLPPGQTDPGLRQFSLAHDSDTISVLRQALRINPRLRIFATPWSPPAWMKTNGSLTNSHFDGQLKQQFYGAYANYFVKFIQGYASAGIPIYAITPQNEPGVPASTYEGASFPAEASAYFIRDYLRPALRGAHLATMIYGDEQGWAEGTYAKVETAGAGGLAGLTWHCYDGSSDQAMPQFRYLPQVMSECGNNLIHSPAGPLMTNVFNDGASAAGLWNLALDRQRGPKIGTGCPGCLGVITVDAQTHQTSYSPDFYELAQFGRFLEPGARRIAATRLGYFVNTSGSDRATPGLHDVAFRNPDGEDVLVTYNNSRDPIEYTVKLDGRRAFTHTVSAGATTTYVWRS